MSKTLLRHTLIAKYFWHFSWLPYLYTFSLYENASFIIVTAETEYISTRSWYRNTLSLLFKKCYCLPFERYCVTLWLIGGVRRFSVMCCVCFVYLRSLYCTTIDCVSGLSIRRYTMCVLYKWKHCYSQQWFHINCQASHRRNSAIQDQLVL